MSSSPEPIDTSNERDARWAKLMLGAQEGDAIAYEQLLREVQPVLNAYFSRRCSDDTAQDLVQETLLAVHRARHTYLPGRPFPPWLFAIAHNKFVDSMRGRAAARKRVLVHSEAALGQLEAPSNMGTGNLLKSTLNALSLKPRKIFGLLQLRGLSVRQVSEELKISESDVKVTSHRAQKIIVGELES